MSSHLLPLDSAQLSPASRRLAERLFDAHPEFRPAAKMKRGGAHCDLHVAVPSPTGDAKRGITVWVEGEEPALGFGDWQMRGGVWGASESEASLLRLLDAILVDKVVLLADATARPGVHAGVMDLSDEPLMPRDWTATASSGRFKTLSWSGAADREIGISVQ